MLWFDVSNYLLLCIIIIIIIIIIGMRIVDATCRIVSLSCGEERNQV